MAELILNVLDHSGPILNVVDGTVTTFVVQRGPVQITSAGGDSLWEESSEGEITPVGAAAVMLADALVLEQLTAPTDQVRPLVVDDGGLVAVGSVNSPNGLLRLNGAGQVLDVQLSSEVVRQGEMESYVDVNRVLSVPYIVTGDVTVSTLAAAMAGQGQPSDLLVLLGYPTLSLNVQTGAAVAFYPAGTVTGGAKGLYEFDGTDLTFVRDLDMAQLTATLKVIDGDATEVGYLGPHGEPTMVDLGGGPTLVIVAPSMPGTATSVDASAFTGNLAVTDDTLQKIAAKLDALTLGGTVDVVSNVASSRILGRTTSGSGDSEELTAAQARSLLGVSWTKIADRTIAAGGSASESFDVTGYQFVKVLFAGSSERASNQSTLYCQFNGDTSNVYSTDASVLTDKLTLGLVPGASPATDRAGLVQADMQLLEGFVKTGVATATALGSSSTTAASAPRSREQFCSLTAAITSLQLSCQSGDIAAGTRIIVMGM